MPSAHDLHTLNELTLVVSATVGTLVLAAILLSVLELDIWWSVVPAGAVAVALAVRARKRYTLEGDSDDQRLDDRSSRVKR